MNWTILIIFGVAIIALIIFLVVRNKKDEIEFEDQLKNDYRKPINDKEDEEVEERVK